MAAITTKVDICNLAISGNGNRNTIMNIDTPKNDKELVFSKWYDITRQLLLKTLIPNFALNRLNVSEKAVPDGYADTYKKCYEYPKRCLKLLGIGPIDTAGCHSYTVEGNTIFTDYDNGSGYLPIRIIDDITDVTLFSPDFVITLAAELKKRTSLAITQDPTKLKIAAAEAISETSNSSALNAQENKPIRRSVSRFRESRDRVRVIDNAEKQ